MGGFASPLELTRLVRTTAAACASATALVAEVRPSWGASPGYWVVMRRFGRPCPLGASRS